MRAAAKQHVAHLKLIARPALRTGEGNGAVVVEEAENRQRGVVGHGGGSEQLASAGIGDRDTVRSGRHLNRRRRRARVPEVSAAPGGR